MLPFPILLLHLYLFASPTSSVPILGLDSFLDHQSRLDLAASNDSYPSIPSSLKSSLSHLSTLPSPFTLLSFSTSVPIQIKLVGAHFPPDIDHLLQTFIGAAHTFDLFHIIASNSPSHHLSISHSLHLDVSHSLALAFQVYDAICFHLNFTISNLRSTLNVVPYSVVDSIIKQDFSKEQ